MEDSYSVLLEVERKNSYCGVCLYHTHAAIAHEEHTTMPYAKKEFFKFRQCHFMKLLSCNDKITTWQLGIALFLKWLRKYNWCFCFTKVEYAHIHFLFYYISRLFFFFFFFFWFSFFCMKKSQKNEKSHAEREFQSIVIFSAVIPKN